MEDQFPSAADFVSPAPDLGALIGSRICHDLNNPLGAIGNGLELLELSGHKAGPEIALIAQSLAHAKARLQFLRVALGAAAPGQRMAAAEVAAIVADHFRGGRVTVDWPALTEPERGAVKLAFLGLMCLETAMPFGGHIAVATDGAAWRLTGTATRLRDLGSLWDMAMGRAPMTEVGAPLVQFALLPGAVQRQRRSLSVETGEGAVALTF